ncbi:MAG: tetratricopeptide repeat protein, partial [Bacteriovoracaceae bacterium]
MKSFWILFLFLFVSCFKTAEEIKREKMVDQMSSQMEQSGQLVAELTQKVDDLQGRLASATGQIQEIDHLQKKSSEEQKQTMEQSIAQLQAQVKALNDEGAENKKLLLSLQSELADQKKYLQRVNRSLNKVAKAAQGPTLSDANKLFEANKMSEAKEAYLQVLEEGKLNAAQTNAVWYNVGLINFWNKKYDTAASYFSKIYTKWPKSSYAPRSLLYIARSFDKSGKKAEAKAAYSELVKN